MPPAPSSTDEPRRWTTAHPQSLYEDAEIAHTDTFRELAASAAQACACAIGLVQLLGDAGASLQASHGLDGRKLNTLNFCRAAVRHGGLFEVHDARDDARFVADPAVTQDGLRFYAAAPLVLDGVALGTLCVIDHTPRALQTTERELLQRLARVASGLLRGRQRLKAVHAERERLMDLARSSGDWMWETDAALRYTWVSGRFEDITGFDATQVRGQTLADATLLDEFGHPLPQGQTLHTLLRQQQPLARIVTAETTPHGVLQISRSAVPVFDAHGEFAGYRGTARDVSQQMAGEQLHADKEAAERANRAKSEFLSRVSHELRTPLNGILGFAQLMALDHAHPLDPDQAHRLDNVLRAGRHLLDLINDVLNLARIEHDDFTLQQLPVDLASSVDAVVALLQPQALATGVRLIAPVLPKTWASADARAVEQVLLNLLSNAIKYNRPHGAVRIAVAHTGEGVCVSVSDEGEGFTPEQQALLFQPFHRFGADKRRVEGSGLGLVIARELGVAMGGELRVETSPGRGSTFTLSLPPGVPPRDAVVTPPLAPAPLVAPVAQPSAQREVLYIEDEPLNVLLMHEVFRSRPQWRLRVAVNGREGLAMARERTHDLLLIDMNLPDMSGLELIRELRADPRFAQQRCVALSADAMQSQIDAALAAGFDGYWTKPIHVGRILEGLGQILPQ